MEKNDYELIKEFCQIFVEKFSKAYRKAVEENDVDRLNELDTFMKEFGDYVCFTQQKFEHLVTLWKQDDKEGLKSFDEEMSKWKMEDEEFKQRLKLLGLYNLSINN